MPIDYKAENKTLRKEVGVLQQKIKEAGIPVLILFEGWESSGKGTLINELIREMDPRGFTVRVYDKPTDIEKRKPFLWPFWEGTPPVGNINIFDRSHYLQLMKKKKIKRNLKNKEISDIKLFEKQLYDGGTKIIKFFVEISGKTQKKRVKALQKNKWESFRVTKRDLNQIKHRKGFENLFGKIIEKTNFDFAPWHVITGENKQESQYEMFTLIKEKLNQYLAEQKEEKPDETIVLQPMPEKSHQILAQVDLSQSLTKEVYREELKKLQTEAKELAYALYVRKIPTIIVFEGWDAGGKGGAIKRLTQPVDPRGFNVIPVAAPDTTEKKYNYMWRFYKNLPKTGHMAIFDRSWYGRLMVERVEGFATTTQYQRSYGEINANEKHFVNWGALVIKFFLHISKEEQLARFTARQEDPDKNYKITDEDWRNREKWDLYLDAIQEMLYRTSTEYAPWTIIPGNDKYYARVQVLKTFVEAAKKRLKQEEKKGN